MEDKDIWEDVSFVECDFRGRLLTVVIAIVVDR